MGLWLWPRFYNEIKGAHILLKRDFQCGASLNHEVKWEPDLARRLWEPSMSGSVR